MYMSLEDYTRVELLQILIDTVHALVMYPHHKAYTRDVIIHEKPDIDPNELAVRLDMPLGEALVILSELNEDKQT
jgi:hypothetical protein